MASDRQKQHTGNTQYNRIMKIVVDGKEVRPVECMWVVTDPQGTPRKAFPSDTSTRDNVARAARVNWFGDSNAIVALNEGWHLEIMTINRFVTEVAGKMVPLDDES